MELSSKVFSEEKNTGSLLVEGTLNLLDHPEFSAIEIIIVLEGHVNIADTSTMMWKFFNNLDPKRDFYFNAGRLGIDVTQKFHEEGYQQNWPDEIEMTAKIKTQVDNKWNDLFKE